MMRKTLQMNIKCYIHFLTGPDGYDHADNIYEYAIANKYNIIKNLHHQKIKVY